MGIYNTTANSSGIGGSVLVWAALVVAFKTGPNV
jgi:hypothetical protein